MCSGIWWETLTSTEASHHLPQKWLQLWRQVHLSSILKWWNVRVMFITLDTNPACQFHDYATSIYSGAYLYHFLFPENLWSSEFHKKPLYPLTLKQASHSIQINVVWGIWCFQLIYMSLRLSDLTKLKVHKKALFMNIIKFKIVWLNHAN